MSKHLFKTTANGKLDISVTVYNKEGGLLRCSSATYDSKPTIKEVIERNFVHGAERMEISSTPSWQIRNYKITCGENNEIKYKKIN